MSSLNWGWIQDGGAFESLMHALLYAEEPGTILFGRPGKDAGQDARSADGEIVYQAKYRQALVMDDAIKLALEELVKIKKYQKPDDSNYEHWKNSKKWILVANLSINPNDDQKWKNDIAPVFLAEGLTAEYWTKEMLEGKLADRSDSCGQAFGGHKTALRAQESLGPAGQALPELSLPVAL